MQEIGTHSVHATMPPFFAHHHDFLLRTLSSTGGHREGHMLTREFRISRSRAVLRIHEPKAVISLSRPQGCRLAYPIYARIPLLLALRARSSAPAFHPTVVPYLVGPYNSNSLCLFTPLLDIARRLATRRHKSVYQGVYQYLGSLQ